MFCFLWPLWFLLMLLLPRLFLDIQPTKHNRTSLMLWPSSEYTSLVTGLHFTYLWVHPDLLHHAPVAVAHSELVQCLGSFAIHPLHDGQLCSVWVGLYSIPDCWCVTCYGYSRCISGTTSAPCASGGASGHAVQGTPSSYHLMLCYLYCWLYGQFCNSNSLASVYYLWHNSSCEISSCIVWWQCGS